MRMVATNRLPCSAVHTRQRSQAYVAPARPCQRKVAAIPPVWRVGRCPPVSERRSAQLVQAGTQPATATDHHRAAHLISRLQQLAGQRNGLDRNPEQLQEIDRVLQELGQRNPTPAPAQQQLRGTCWRLLFTTAARFSGGKFGPLIAREFPAEEEGIYYNMADLGFATARLRAQYRPMQGDPQKISVTLQETVFRIGPFRFKQALPDRSSFWRMTYADDQLRIIHTEAGNVFVLLRQ